MRVGCGLTEPHHCDVVRREKCRRGTRPVARLQRRHAGQEAGFPLEAAPGLDVGRPSRIALVRDECARQARRVDQLRYALARRAQPR